MLSVKNLYVAYGQSEIIHGISFEAKQGEIVAIMGRNGMGKTTLMKSLIGINRARSGHIELNNEDITELPTYMRVKNGVAYVPQGRQIFSSLTVEENILTGMEYTLDKKEELLTNAYNMFPVLFDMSTRKGGNLSGGQQQQLAIARALVAEPKVLILDEPTEGIQPSIIKDMARMLNQIKVMHNLTIVVSEQVLNFTVNIADRLYVMESGNFIHEDVRGSIDEKKITSYLSV
ncbi:urea ABC transporter ATP-binding subunit UrtE [Desulfobacula sp.]|uniref:urea ABC transporter ATP-binding subunit UrtE n=1 Tax=Desulfobacula sp. TaxID=2593537 RepID=UPI00262FC041|nr:urea ABC transporter ATP-binding subunit UrtE [Desulfobacula sp.]